MNRSSFSSRAALPVAVLLAAVAILVLVAGGAFGRGADPSPAPSSSPSSGPSAPSAPSTPQPTVEPTDEPSGGPVDVDLENLTDHDVSVVVDDETGTLAGATSGKPGDGMSVRWFDSKVENLDGWDSLPCTFAGILTSLRSQPNAAAEPDGIGAKENAR